jgi:hypothetical protein
MFASRNIQILFSGVFVTMLLAATLLNAPSASAYTRRHVCADSLYVRDSHMVVIGTLYRGHTFDIYRSQTDNYTVYGYAWGYVNKWGYVYPQYLC